MHETLFELWGKTIKNDQGFHPALYHMIDVGFTAQALLDAPGLTRLRTMLRLTWHGAHYEALIRCLPFLISVHDIGKVSVPFQGQASNAETRYHRHRLIGLGIPFPAESEVYRRLPHTIVGALFLKEHLRSLENTVDGNVALIVRDAISGHHGRFPASMSVWRKAREDLALLREDPYWHAVRVAGYHVLRDTFLPPTMQLAEIGTPTHLRTATLALTGLIVFADWIGSESGFFEPTTATSLNEYIKASEDRAREAVERLGFTSSQRAVDDVQCGDLFPYCAATPRGVQQGIDTLPLDDQAGPTLTVIEASAGEGKTEAGLTLARRLAAYGGADSFFFGLPTMATSNQMFQRVRAVLHAQHGPSSRVSLIHGSAHLLDRDEAHAVQQGAPYDGYQKPYTDADHALSSHDADHEPSGIAALHWFRGSKKNLLIPFGVGTVDQIELAGLNTRYYMLRLVALAGKTVIIDEVHAYDTYMSTILDHTLTWLALMGCHVILLSATLPKARHADLVNAFLKGCNTADSVSSAALPDTYPRISHYHAQGHRHDPVPAARRHEVTIQWADTPTIDSQIDHLLDLVQDGGAVARICNRADAAQDLYRQLLRRNLDDSYTVVLVHAKLPLDERLRAEAQVAALVGKETQRTASDRIIIIGTQVLEQSLDYDVDVMVSDLAPIDLLLQRIGRLYRHDLPFWRRGAQHHVPILYIVSPIQQRAGAVVPSIDAWQMIYAPFILYQTWVVLGWQRTIQPTTIQLPDAYRRLVEGVYHDAPPQFPDDMHPSWVSRLESAWADLREKKLQDEQHAYQRLTPNPQSNDTSILSGDHLPFIADEDGSIESWQAAKTRLGERIMVIPVYRTASGVSLDAAGKDRVPADHEADVSVAEQQRLLARSLPLSSPAWCLPQIRSRATWHWTKVPALLKHIYPLYLHPDGRAEINPRLRLEPVIGLYIDKEDVSDDV